MKNGLLFLLVISFVMLACLNPPHDNEYDPDNPNKAYLGGKTYRLDDTPLPQAQIRLMHESEVLDSTKSDDQGRFKFTDIDPGIYKIIAEANYYKSVEFYPESLPAGTENDSFDIYFYEIHFDFENEASGTQEPNGFQIISGDWKIKEDQSGEHSKPNVYNGVNTTTDTALTIIKEGLNDFWFNCKLKVMPLARYHWDVGTVLRYQDKDNYYLLKICPCGKIQLIKKLAGVESLIGSADHPIKDSTWYSVAVDFSDSNIQIFLNDSIMLYVSDNAISSGKIGLWLNNPENIVSVNFDDITICR